MNSPLTVCALLIASLVAVNALATVTVYPGSGNCGAFTCSCYCGFIPGTTDFMYVGGIAASDNTGCTATTCTAAFPTQCTGGTSARSYTPLLQPLISDRMTPGQCYTRSATEGGVTAGYGVLVQCSAATAAATWNLDVRFTAGTPSCTSGTLQSAVNKTGIACTYFSVGQSALVDCSGATNPPAAYSAALSLASSPLTALFAIAAAAAARLAMQ